MLETLILKYPYPCHKTRGVRLTYYPLMPKQRFDRKCPVCNLEWDILVTQLRYSLEGISIHRSEWGL